MTENHQSDLDDPATWPLIEGEDEPIGYDGFGAPLYPWQQTKPLGWNKPPADIRPLMSMIDETVRAMLIPSPELPEAFKAQHDINQIHKALEPNEWYGWKEVGYLTDEAFQVEWKDATPMHLEAVRGALSALADHQLTPARQIWITGLTEPEDEFQKAIVEEQTRALIKAQDDALRYQLTTWSTHKLEIHYDEINYEAVNLLFGYDIRPPFCQQEIPAKGTE